MHTSHPADKPLSSEPSPWVGPAIGLMDLDAFFASVEVLDHPEWKGKPVIVGGKPGERGVVSTCSYEARKFGVHSAMPSAEAERRCPQAIWVSGRMDRYREVSNQVMQILKDETPLVQQESIDEAFFDITPGHYSRESPVAICKRIQQRVAELGVSCSLGLSTSKSVSKIASEQQKPNGFVVVAPGQEANFLRPLPVGALSGVGKRSQETLVRLGIKTLGQLAQANDEFLRQQFGKMGPELKRRAAGCEHSPVVSEQDAPARKSLSVERTFAHDLTTQAEVTTAVRHIAAKLASRLRDKNLRPGTLTLKLHTSWQDRRTQACRLEHQTNDELTIAQAALSTLSEIWSEGQPVRLLGISSSEFTPRPPEQLTLFSAESAPQSSGGHTQAATPAQPQRDKLNQTRDTIRKKFGAKALMYGFDLPFSHEDALTQTVDSARASKSHHTSSPHSSPADKLDEQEHLSAATCY